MSNEYVKKEIDGIINDASYPYPLGIAMAASWLLINLKGTQVKILKTGESSSLCDYFIIASAQNPMQADTMADWLGHELKSRGIPIRSREGSRLSDWLLIDAGEIIIHIFLESARELYKLDELWGNSPVVSIPESFYFGQQLLEEQMPTIETSEHYF